MRSRPALKTLALVVLLAPASAGALVPRERSLGSGGEEAVVRVENGSWFSQAFAWLVGLFDEENGEIVPKP
jgi:hypothetical protein